MPVYYGRDRIIVECHCGHPEHQVQFSKDDDFVYVSYCLHSMGFWERVKDAVKHVFGHKSEYGAFGVVCLGIDEVTEIRDYLMEWADNEV